MSIKTKIVLLTISCCVLLLVSFMGNILYQEKKAATTVDQSLEDLMRQNTKSVVLNVRNQIKALNEVLQDEVNNSLNVAWEIVKQKGKLALNAAETVEWKAVNQYTKDVTKVTIPKMVVGDTWLGQNSSMAKVSPVVDDVKRLCGGTATIFQKINDRGDMLRVCTNVEKLDKTRAIGTYIPAVNPDGKENPVVQTLMSGKTFHGRAFVVNAWYLTAYEPIYNNEREIIGALYFGIQQEKAKALREGIYNCVVGKTGYIYVLDREGHYIISKGGQRDGEDIWNSKDSDGKFFIQSIVRKALAVKEGEVDYEEYEWKNIGETESRTKIAAITYFEPWDWVIGAGTYVDDFKDASTKMHACVNDMVVWGGVIGLVVLVGVVLVSLMLSSKITDPINTLTDVANDISRGNIDRKIDIKTKDETGMLSEAFKRMQASLVVLMKRAKKQQEKEKTLV